MGSKISWVVRMFVHPKAVQEFGFALRAIQPIMTNPKYPRSRKRKTLNMMVNELSESTFNLKPIAEQIMGIINMEGEVCREYPNSEIQTDGILGWLPRMKFHRDILLGEVAKHRKEYNLGI